MRAAVDSSAADIGKLRWSDMFAPNSLARIVEPDHVEWAGIANPLLAVQIAPIQTIQQMSQPVGVWTIHVGLELKVERMSSGICSSIFRSKNHASFWNL